MSLPLVRVTREQMRKRVAYFHELQGHDGGLPDSSYPSAERTLFNALGFQRPQGDVATVSPVGSNAAETSAIKINEGFNIGFCEALPGKGPMMHNHDTNETFMPISGTWRCSWEVDGQVEYFDVGPCDIISFPAGVQRRFENISFDEPDQKKRLMFVIGGNAPKAEFSPDAMDELRATGHVTD